MLAERSLEGATVKAPGRLSKALLRLLMKRATVVAAEALTDRFRLITLEGAALRDVAWTPGQKLQVAMGSAFVARTYTPIEWNASAGRTCILGYAHGQGPGSAWVRNVQPGDECDFFGPRASLAASHIAGPLALFGDETSIGLAHCLSQQDRNRPVTCHLEVDDLARTREVAGQLGIKDAMLCGKTEDDRHLREFEAATAPLVANGASFVLTGRAGAIQRLRLGLKERSVPSPRIITKAYWTPGKKGLD